MMVRLKFLFFAFCISVTVLAQTPTEADALFQSKNYVQAQEAYGKLLKRKPKDALYNYRYALTAYELKKYDEAIQYFPKAGAKFPLKDFYLGKIYFDRYHFDEAVVALNNYLANFNPADTQLLEAQQLLRKAELGARFLNRVEDVAIVDSVVVNKNDFLKKIRLNPDLGSLVQSPIRLSDTISVDKIEYKTQRGDRIFYSDTLNGQLDLFTADKLLNDWGEPVRLTDISTSANENYPFLMLDGVTLYFASDGNGSMGGYDIFITRFNTTTNKYLEPENVGMPFNSPYNDYMMIIDDVRHIGWFASDRFQPEGKVAFYQFIPNTEKKIVRTENRDSLISLAQAKLFSSIEKPIVVSIQNDPPASQNTGKPKIIITESIIYSDAGQFKSDIARNAYFELQKATSELGKIESELTNARQNYARTANEGQKQSLGANILSMESKQRELIPKIKILTKQMRNEEIKILGDNLDFNK